MTLPQRLLFTLTAVGLLLGGFWIGRIEGDYGGWIRIVLAFSMGIGTAVAVTVLLARKIRPDSWWFAFVILVALIVRLFIIQASRDLSDDAARYHWDGKVVAHGINPYLHPPDAPEVAHLRIDPLDERINHPSVVTVYPPLAELLFGTAYLVTPGSLLGYQLLELIAELTAWLLLLRELVRRKLPGARLLLIAWIPLAVVEGYLPGHVDLLALPFLVLLILEAERRNAIRAGLFFAFACLIKPLPLIFLPAIVRQLGWNRSIRFLVVAGLVVGMFYLPFLGAGERLYSSMLLMARQWSFNGSLGALFEAFLSMEAAHRLSAIVAVLLVFLGTWRGTDLLSRMLLALVAWIICTPTLFPWYLVWVLPLLVLRPDPALIALVILAPLTEEVLIGYHADGVWKPAVWPMVVEYGLFYALLALGMRRRWGMFRRAPTTRAG